MSKDKDQSDAKRAAVFFDRDGTLIEDVHYLSDPADVRLLPGTAEALKVFREHELRCVVVSNQSAVGRGVITEARLEEIHDEVRRQLAEEGAEVDAIYWCPVVPATDDRSVIEHEDRKPGPGMLLRAASDLNLDLSRSWMVGDSLSDLLAGKNAGCFKCILVNPRAQEAETLRQVEVDYETCEDMNEVAQTILKETRSTG